MSRSRPTLISEYIYPGTTGWRVIDAYSPWELRLAAISHVEDRGIRALREIGGTVAEIDAKDHVLMHVDGKSPAFIPSARFGDFTAIERDEVEAFRSVQSLLRSYMGKADEEKPISIAVFGPPGAGKSFGVEEVAKSIESDEGTIKVSRFNLAQFSSPNDLVIPLLSTRDYEHSVLPMIFFDEFDCSLGDVPLGWLRYFLQPMQDGMFKHNEEIRKVGRAIFVFAGGTSSCFRDFTRADADETARETFRLAKGPDFVSRLSGFIDTYGINKRGSSDKGYVLRRAILLRSLLERRELIGMGYRALIDSWFIETLLDVEKYNHGARSMETILKMCVGPEGALRIVAPGQLEMHVGVHDAEMIWSNAPKVR